MKPYAVIFAGTLATVGCSSSSTDSAVPMLDEEMTQNASEAIDTGMIIRSVLSVINTDLLKEAIDKTPTPSDQNSFTLIEPDGPSERTFACPISGTVSIDNGTGGTGEYNNCVVENGVFNGKYRSTGASGISIVGFDGFSIVQDDSHLVIERGLLEYRESLDPDRTRQWRWTDTVFSNTADENSFEATITELNLERTGDDEYHANIDAAVTIGGTIVTVSTNTPLTSQNGDRYYTSGQFQINSVDDFSISLDADGGDAESVLITVTVDGRTDSQIRSWSDEFYVDCLSELWPARPTIDCK